MKLIFKLCYIKTPGIKAKFYVGKLVSNITRRFSNHESRLLSRSHTFAIIVILDLKIHQSMWIHWPFFPKTWTKGHWPLDDLWPHVCWGHMCDSTQGSLCPSPMGIHQCMWIQWSILLVHYHIHTYITTYIHILRTYYVQTEWSHSLLLNSVQARQKCNIVSEFQRFLLALVSCHFGSKTVTFYTGSQNWKCFIGCAKNFGKFYNFKQPPLKLQIWLTYRDEINGSEEQSYPSWFLCKFCDQG